MVGQEGGRWDVGSKNNAVYLERISESDERLFDDLLAHVKGVLHGTKLALPGMLERASGHIVNVASYAGKP